MCSVFSNAAKDIGAKRSTVVRDCNARHLAWLRRGPEQAAAKWRPPKFHRRSVVAGLRRMDNQIRVSTHWDGIVSLQYKPAQDGWGDTAWRTWPSLTFCGDQAGDNTSMVHCCGHKLNMNLTEWWDWSHGCANDMKDSMKTVGLWPLQILLLVVHNLGHGPERDEMLRFHQINESLKFLFEHFDAKNCELFKARAPAILQEMSHKVDFKEDMTANESLFEHLKQDSAYPKIGHQTRMCQFMGFQERNQELLDDWTCRLFKAELLALECDWLSSAAVKQRLKVNTDVLEEAGKETTTSKRVVHPDVKLLRGGQQNAVCITVLTLGEPTHKRLIAGVTLLSEPVQKWRGTSAKSTRSPAETRDWLCQQMQGDFSEHVWDIWNVFCSDAFIRKAGFLGFEDAPLQDKLVVLEEDDRMCAVFGKFGIHLFAARIRRCFYAWHGWPHRLFRILLSDEDARDVIAAFKSDYESYHQLQRVVNPCNELQEILGRSVFTLPKAKQWVCAFQASAWTKTDDIMQMAHEKAGGLSSSLMVEEFIHYMKNMKRSKTGKRLRRPHRAMATVIGQQLLETRFDFKPVVVQASVGGKRRKVSESGFVVAKDTETLDLSGIATLKQKASYYSPTAADLCRLSTDRVVMQNMASHKQYQQLKNTSMNVMCDSSRAFVFRERKMIGGGDACWYMGLFNVKGSGAVAQRVNLVESPSKSKLLYVVPEPIEPTMLLVTSWTNYVARPTRWQSWSWQCTHMPEVKGNVAAANRLFVTDQERPLTKLAAEQAWWDLDTTDLKHVASGCKLAVSAGASEFMLLFEMTSEVLGTDDDGTLKVLLQRLEQAQPDETFMDALMELDEAQQVVDQRDVEEITQAHTKIRASNQVFASLQ